MCFYECLPEKLCLSAATIVNDLDFLFSMFWLLTVGQVKAVLGLRAGKSCRVGCDPLLLLTNFVYGSIPFHRIVSNWHVATRVNSSAQLVFANRERVNEFSQSLMSAVGNRTFSSAFMHSFAA